MATTLKTNFENYKTGTKTTQIKWVRGIDYGKEPNTIEATLTKENLDENLEDIFFHTKEKVKTPSPIFKRVKKEAKTNYNRLDDFKTGACFITDKDRIYCSEFMAIFLLLGNKAKDRRINFAKDDKNNLYILKDLEDEGYIYKANCCICADEFKKGGSFYQNPGVYYIIDVMKAGEVVDDEIYYMIRKADMSEEDYNEFLENVKNQIKK